MTVVLLDGAAIVATWPVDQASATGSGRLDLGAVDALARLQLGARRLGLSLELHHACPRLLELLELAGLPIGGALPVEAGGEPERREELGVQEAVEPGDQPA